VKEATKLTILADLTGPLVALGAIVATVMPNLSKAPHRPEGSPEASPKGSRTNRVDAAPVIPPPQTPADVHDH
jgi:hypothetical protein